MAGRNTLTLFIIALATALFILPSASADATQAGCEIASSSPYSDYAAVASISDDGHLAADVSIFPNYLYCNQTMVNLGRDAEILSYASGGEISGAQQGHISEAGSFPNALTGNWTACTLDSGGSCDVAGGEACLVGVTNSGALAGSIQGQAAACGTTNFNICCCPTGSEWDPFASECVETGDLILISGPTGPANTLPSREETYQVSIQWGMTSPLSYEFYAQDNMSNPVGASLTGTTGANSGTIPLQENFTFPSGGSYQVCAYGELQSTPSINQTTCLNVTVQPVFVQLTPLQGPAQASSGSTNTYTTNASWGTSSAVDFFFNLTNSSNAVIDTYTTSNSALAADDLLVSHAFTLPSANEVYTICAQATLQVTGDNTTTCTTTTTQQDSVTTTTPTGELNPAANSTHTYTTDITWGQNSALEYQWQLRDSTSSVIQQTSWTTDTQTSATNKAFTTDFTPPLQATTYDVCIQARLATNNSIQDEKCQAITTLTNYLTLAVSGPNIVAPTSTNAYTTDISYGYSSSLDYVFFAREAGNPTPAYNQTISANQATQTIGSDFTFTSGPWQVCVAAQTDTFTQEECLNVSAGSDFASVDTITVNGQPNLTSPNNLLVNDTATIQSQLSWGYTQGITYEFYTRLQGAGFTDTRAGESGTRTNTNIQDTISDSWSHLYNETGRYRAYTNVTLQDNSANNFEYTLVDVGEEFVPPVPPPPYNGTCSDINASKYYGGGCSETVPTNDTTWAYDAISEDFFCTQASETPYCHFCQEGYDYNTSTGTCQDQCVTLQDFLNNPGICGTPQPLAVELIATPISGQAPLTVEFQINASTQPGFGPTNYTLNTGNGTYSAPSGDTIIINRTHTYDKPIDDGPPPGTWPPFTATLEVNDQYRTNNTAQTITLTCVSDGNQANYRQECCSGPSGFNSATNTCAQPATISGYVQRETQFGELVEVNSGLVQLKHAIETNRNTTIDSTGYYEFTSVPGLDNYELTATYLENVGSVNFNLTPGGTQQINITVIEQQYFPGCVNAQGRCDRNALGWAGCLNDTSDPNFNIRRDVLNACDPIGSSGRKPGDLVTIDRNETHLQTALCCAEVPQWQEAPRADIEGNVNNLIKYTRLTNYLGQPVNLVIVTWN